MESSVTTFICNVGKTIVPSSIVIKITILLIDIRYLIVQVYFEFLVLDTVRFLEFESMNLYRLERKF